MSSIRISVDGSIRSAIPAFPACSAPAFPSIGGRFSGCPLCPNMARLESLIILVRPAELYQRSIYYFDAQGSRHRNPSRSARPGLRPRRRLLAQDQGLAGRYDFATRSRSARPMDSEYSAMTTRMRSSRRRRSSAPGAILAYHHKHRHSSDKGVPHEFGGAHPLSFGHDELLDDSPGVRGRWQRVSAWRAKPRQNKLPETHWVSLPRN